jgi:hypothetical protein
MSKNCLKRWVTTRKGRRTKTSAMDLKKLPTTTRPQKTKERTPTTMSEVVV